MKRCGLGTFLHVCLVFFSVSPAALAATPCPWKSQTIGRVEITITSSCTVNIDPLDRPENRSRQWSFTRDGGVLMFVNTEDAPTTSRKFGARSYHLYPYSPTEPKILSQENGSVRIRTASGLEIRVDTETAMVTDIDGRPVRVTSELKHITQMAAVKGGVELSGPFAGRLLMDHGWKLGGAAEGSAGLRTIIYDAAQRSCTLSNSLFKNWTAASDRPISNDEMRVLLDRHCPGIDRTAIGGGGAIEAKAQPRILPKTENPSSPARRAN